MTKVGRRFWQLAPWLCKAKEVAGDRFILHRHMQIAARDAHVGMTCGVAYLQQAFARRPRRG